MALYRKTLTVPCRRKGWQSRANSLAKTLSACDWIVDDPGKGRRIGTDKALGEVDGLGTACRHLAGNAIHGVLPPNTDHGCCQWLYSPFIPWSCLHTRGLRPRSINRLPSASQTSNRSPPSEFRAHSQAIRSGSDSLPRTIA